MDRHKELIRSLLPTAEIAISQLSYVHKCVSNRRLKQLALSLTLLIIISITVSAKAQTIKVVTEIVPPYQLIDQNNQLKGYATEIVQALFEITGDTPDIQVLPWARAFYTAQQESNVMIYSIAHTPERAKQFHWIGAIQPIRFYFWGRDGDFRDPVKSPESLTAHSIAIAKSYNAESYINKLGFAKVHRVDKNSQALAMLNTERVDLVVLNDLMIEQLQEKSAIPTQKTIKLLEATPLNSELSIAFSLKTSPELIERFQAAYQKLVASGQLSQIKQKWLHHLTPRKA